MQKSVFVRHKFGFI